MRFLSLLAITAAMLLPFALCASEECASLAPQLPETCPAFEYASNSEAGLEAEEADLAVQDDVSTELTLSEALNRISTATFDETCCDMVIALNASQCFCEADIVDSLMSEISDELLAFAIFSAARPIPNGCGGRIWTSLDEGPCILLGPELDSGDDTCRSLEDELRNTQLLSGNFALLEEALDATGVLDELSGLRQFVLFAPTDTGIENFAQEQNLTIGELLGETELLTDVLRRHIVTGRNIRDLDENSAEAETLQGTSVTIQRTDNDRFTVQGFPVVQEGVELCRGEVHVINGVLWPPSARNMEPIRDDDLIAQIEQEEAVQRVPSVETAVAVDVSPIDEEEDEVADVELSLPCACASDGVSNEVDTGALGCAQHRIEMRDNALFCYISDSELCDEDASDVFESQSFPGAFWRSCERDEASFPSVAEAIAGISYLQHASEFFTFARIEALLSQDDPVTVLIPEMFAFTQLNIGSLLEEGQEGAQQLRMLLRRHVLEGDFTGNELLMGRNLTALDGTAVVVRRDEDDIVILDNNAAVTQANIFTSNGVIHLIDSFFRPHLISSDEQIEPCACIEDEEDADRVPFRRLGCRNHIPDDVQFCYVQDPNACLIGTPSGSLLGAKWRGCIDPCRCSETGLSGSIDTNRQGCAEHVLGDPLFCYIAEPERCREGTPSTAFPGATWKWCGRTEEEQDEDPTVIDEVVEEEGAAEEQEQEEEAVEEEEQEIVEETPPADPCDCSEDGVSGGVDTGNVGCGSFGTPSFIDICYVVDPDECSISLPSIRFGGAAWRFC